MTEPWEKRQAQFTRLMDRMNGMPAFREATVTSVNPISVKFDTDVTSTVAHSSIADDLAVGSRVLTMQLKHYVWVLGKRGVIRIEDWDDAQETGFYWGVNSANRPPETDGWWMAIVQRGESSYGAHLIKQMLHRPNRAYGIEYSRYSIDGGATWSGWANVGYDTGWQNVTVNSGYAAQGSVLPQVRRIGKVVHARWGWSNTGVTPSAAHTVGVIPEGFRPSQSVYFRWGTNSAASVAGGVVFNGGSVEIRTPPSTAPLSNAAYYLFPALTWLID